MSWGSLPNFFEGEDEGALRLRFIELSAKWYKTQYTPEEIAGEVFSGLPDAYSRGLQAGQYWSRQLEVQEAIRQKALGIGSTEELPSKEQIIAELLALARNERIDAKDRNTAYKTALEAAGHITKQVDKTVKTVPQVPSAIVFKAVDFDRDPDEEEQAA